MGRGMRLKATFSVTIGLFLSAASAAQEVDFQGWEDHPGLYFHLLQPARLWRAAELSGSCSVVRDHVSGETALRLEFAAGRDEAAAFLYMPPTFAVSNRGPSRGISFWVKGDGSDGVGVIGIGKGRGSDPRAEFLLRSRQWQPVRLRWNDFDRAIATPRIRSFFFTVTPQTKRPASYLIDRIEVVRAVGPAETDDEVRAAGAEAAKLPEPRSPEDLSAFVARREGLAGIRRLVAEKKPVRVLVIGDSIAQGAALWNVPAGVRARYLFWGALHRRLRGAGSETTVVPVFVEGPEDAAARIRGALASVKPHVVVVQLSSSRPGVAPGERTRAHEAVRRLLTACRRRNTPVLALAVPPLPGPLRRINHGEILLEEAARANAAACDFSKLAAARGKGFEGEFYATAEQLNVQGHLLAARLLTSVLSNP